MSCFPFILYSVVAAISFQAQRETSSTLSQLCPLELGVESCLFSGFQEGRAWNKSHPFSHCDQPWLKAKGPKPDNKVGLSREYNVWNIISQGTNALPRHLSTLIPTPKKKDYYHISLRITSTYNKDDRGFFGSQTSLEVWHRVLDHELGQGSEIPVQFPQLLPKGLCGRALDSVTGIRVCVLPVS